MNIKSLLLGSAAALAAVSMANAAPIANIPTPDNPAQAYEDPFPGAAMGIAMGGTKVVAPQDIALGEDVGPMKKPNLPGKLDAFELAGNGITVNIISDPGAGGGGGGLNLNGYDTIV